VIAHCWGGGSHPCESAVVFYAWRWRMPSFEASMVYDFACAPASAVAMVTHRAG